MDIKRGIEYAVLVLLLLIPTYAMLNEVARLRMERIDDYLTFPTHYQDFSPTDKYAIDRIRDLLLKNSGEKYYNENGLTCEGDEFLEREKELFGFLEQLGCMKFGTLGVWYDPLVRDCNELLRNDTIKLLDKTLRRDLKLLDYTAEQYDCKILEYENIWDYGNKIMMCTCGIMRT